MGKIFRFEPNKKLEQITLVRLPFDIREYDNKKIGGTGTSDFGVHGLDVTFVLKGEKGAVQLMVNFPVFLEATHQRWLRQFGDRDGIRTSSSHKIMGYDVGYHAKEPQYDGQKPMGRCDLFPELTDGCFYDGSSLRAEAWVDEIFSTINEPPENVLWKKLEQEYIERFGEP